MILTFFEADLVIPLSVYSAAMVTLRSLSDTADVKTPVSDIVAYEEPTDNDQTGDTDFTVPSLIVTEQDASVTS